MNLLLAQATVDRVEASRQSTLITHWDVVSLHVDHMRKRLLKMPSTHRPHNKLEVGRVLTKLMRFHEQGEISLTRDGDRMGYGLLKKGNKSPSQQEHQRKARAFAKAYDHHQLEQLISQCRNAKTDFSVSHIKCLLAVVPASVRGKLQEAAIKNDWSKSRLQLEIRRLFGSRKPKAGRRQMPMKNSKEINPRISQFAERWRRFRRDVGDLTVAKPLSRTTAFEKHLTEIDKEFAAVVKLINDMFESKGK